MSGPYEQNHPRLAFIQPLTLNEPSTLMAIHGESQTTVPLTPQMLLQIVEQGIVELRKLYGSAKSTPDTY